MDVVATLSVTEEAPRTTIGLSVDTLGCFLLRGGPNLTRGSACDSILFLLAGNLPFFDADGLGIVFVDPDAEESPGEWMTRWRKSGSCHASDGELQA